MDVIARAGSRPSIAHLSLAASMRRGWGSVYAALRRSDLDGAARRAVLPHLVTACDKDHDTTGTEQWPFLPVSVHMLNSKPGVSQGIS